MGLQQAGLQWVNDGLGGFLSGVGQANRAMQDSGSSADNMASKFSFTDNIVVGFARAVGETLFNAFVKVSKAAISLIADTVGVAENFESMATRLEIAGRGAATQAGIALDDLSEAALKVGGDTRLMGVSATGAAQAITDLLKAGLSVDDVMGDFNAYMQEGAKLSGVLGASVGLASASELNMVEASKLATTSMTIFGLTADDVTTAMDYIVRGADSSVASVTDIRDALEGAGPTLRGFGFSIEDSVDALALLSNAGIKGAEAGTALRSAFTQMASNKAKVVAALAEQGVAITDAAGNFMDFKTIVAQLEIATESMTEAERANFLQTIAGAYGKTALTALINQGTVAYDNYSASVQNAAGIQMQAEANANTHAAAVEALKGNIETLRIQIGSVFLPTLTTFTKGFSEVIDLIGPVMGPILTRAGEGLTKLMQGFADATLGGVELGAIGDKIGKVFENFFWMIDVGIEPLKALQMALVAAFGQETADKIIGPITTIRDIISNLGGYFAAVAEDGDYLNDFLANLPAGMQPVVEFIGRIVDAVRTNFPIIRDTVVEVFTKVIETFGNVKTWIETNWPKIQEVVKTVFEAISKIIGSVVKTIGPPIQSLIERIREIDIENVKKGFEIFGKVVKTVAVIIGGVLATALGIAASAIAGIIGFIESMIGTWEQIMEAFRSGDIIGGLLTGFVGVFEGIWKFISVFATSFIDFFSNLLGVDIAGIWTTNWQMLVTIIETVWANIVTAVTTWWETLSGNVTGWFTGLVETWQTNWDSLTGIVSQIGENIKKAINDWLTGIYASLGLNLDDMKARWQAIWNDIVAIVTEVWNRIKTWINTKFLEIKTSISTYLTDISAFWTETWDAISTKVNEIWVAISTYVSEKALALKNFIQNEILTPLQTFWNTTWDAIKKTVTEVWDGIVNAVGPKLEELKTKITEKIEEIKTWLIEQYEKFKQIGYDLMIGMKDGIESAVAYLLTFVTEAIEKVIAAAKAKLGIESPSRVFFEIGKNTMTGFAEAIIGSDTAGLGRDMAASFTSSVNAGLNGIAAQSVMANGGRSDINNSRSVVVEVNANYANAQSEASIYYDVVAALAGARI